MPLQQLSSGVFAAAFVMGRIVCRCQDRGISVMLMLFDRGMFNWRTHESLQHQAPQKFKSKHRIVFRKKPWNELSCRHPDRLLSRVDASSDFIASTSLSQVSASGLFRSFIFVSIGDEGLWTWDKATPSLPCQRGRRASMYLSCPTWCMRSPWVGAGS